MEPAKQKLKYEMKKIKFFDAAVPVVSNQSAEPFVSAEEIRKKLLEQITSPVRWIDVVNRLYAEGVRVFIELGPGKILTGLIKRILRNRDDITLLNAETIEGVKNALQKISRA